MKHFKYMSVSLIGSMFWLSWAGLFVQNISASFSAGIGLWQEDQRYVNTIELNWGQKLNYFTYALEFPFFYSLNKNPFIYGISNNEETPMFQSLSRIEYISGFVSQAYYEDNTFSIGIQNEPKKYPSPFTWGDPSFHSLTPFKESRFLLNLPYVSLMSSSLPNPSLLILTSKIHLLSNDEKAPTDSSKGLNTPKPNALIEELFIESTVWTDLRIFNRLSPAWGMAVKLELFAEHWGMNTTYLYEQNESRVRGFGMYRWRGVLKTGLGLAFQHRQHSRSVLLSPLYPGIRRKNLDITNQEGEASPGYALNILYFIELYSLELKFEVFSPQQPDFTFFLGYNLELKNFLLSFLYMQEKIEAFADFISDSSEKRYVGFRLNAHILKKRLEIGWETYLNTSLSADSVSEGTAGKETWKNRFYTRWKF